jgi:hypothetical protein
MEHIDKQVGRPKVNDCLKMAAVTLFLEAAKMEEEESTRQVAEQSDSAKVVELLE